MEKFKNGEFEKLENNGIDTWYLLINIKFTKEEIIEILEKYQIELPRQNILSSLIKQNNILFRNKVEDIPIYYLTNDLKVTYTSFRNKCIHKEENFYKIIFKKKQIKKTVKPLEEDKKEITKLDSVDGESKINYEFCGCPLKASNRIKHLKEHMLKKHTKKKINSLVEEKKEKIFISDIKNNNLEIKKKAIRLFFKEKDPEIQIKYDKLDLYSVKETSNKMKNTIILFSDEKLKEKIIRDILIIDEVTIKDYLPDSNYNPFLQNRTATICLAVQEYLKIISVARYEKYFKSMKWSISFKYTINDYYMYRKYREIFFDESMCMTCSKFYGKKILIKHEKKCKLKKLVVCEFCQVKVKQKNLKKHLKKCPKKNESNHPTKNKVLNQKKKTSVLPKVKCKYCKKKLKKDEYKQHLQKCSKYKEFLWEESSSIQEIKEESTTLTNIEKHQAIKYQFRENEELDPDLIDEEAYQKTFGTQLDDKFQQIRARIAFEHEKIYKQEEEDKSEIKIFLSKMYKGYCQICGYTFKKTNGVNSFERFNWNDKRVVKVKKSLVSTADSLCLCRNCSANIKWGAFYPNFIDTIREIEEFKNKSYDEIKEKLHKVVDENIPKIFEPLLEFDDVYALEIELDGKPRNIYFTNEHLLQFITYLQKEEEVEEEVAIKKKRKKERDVINSIYNANSWLKREETIPLDLAESFIRATAKWNHPTAHRYVSAPKHADNIYKNSQHGWAVDFGANSFLVGKAIERCKNSINEYIENQQNRNLTELKESLSKHISGAVATSNNYEYSGYYPIEDGYLKFGVQGIDVEDGVNFLIRRLELESHLLSK